MRRPEVVAAVMLVGVLTVVGVFLLLRLSGYAAAVRNIRSTIPAVSQFHSVYPQATGAIEHYWPGMGTTRWWSEVVIDGRYRLTLRFEIKLGVLGRGTRWHAHPAFVLVDEEIPGSGLVEESNIYRLGLEEWTGIVEDGGSLESIEWWQRRVEGER
jgi:hypothetical protein